MSTSRVDGLFNRILELEAALREAIEFADEGWAYADEYFREKWDYQGQRGQLVAVLSEGKK